LPDFADHQSGERTGVDRTGGGAPRPRDRPVLIQAVNRFVEVAHEPAAAEFAVGVDVEAQRLLACQDAQDVLVLDRLELLGIDTSCASLADSLRPQEAAD